MAVADRAWAAVVVVHHAWAAARAVDPSPRRVGPLPAGAVDPSPHRVGPLPGQIALSRDRAVRSRRQAVRMAGRISAACLRRGATACRRRAVARRSGRRRISAPASPGSEATLARAVAAATAIAIRRAGGWTLARSIAPAARAYRMSRAPVAQGRRTSVLPVLTGCRAVATPSAAIPWLDRAVQIRAAWMAFVRQPVGRAHWATARGPASAGAIQSPGRSPGRRRATG